jgi:hypothetical protein
MLSLPYQERATGYSRLSSLFLWLDEQTGHVTPCHPDMHIPATLLPSPQLSWFTQLAEHDLIRLKAALEQKVCNSMELVQSGECWLLELIPIASPRWLLCIRSAVTIMSAEWSGLALVAADQYSLLTHGCQRNRLLLQQLWKLSGCDRMILWRCSEERMTPIHLLGSSALPKSQPIDLRYKKIIRQRKSIGFSDPGSVPMLQNQHYLATDGIRARLDLPISLPRQHRQKEVPQTPDYLLTLEYHSLQNSFSPAEYQSAEHLAALLFQDEQPLELQPLSSLDSELIKLSGVTKAAYWSALSNLFQQQADCQLLIFDPASSKLIFPDMSHARLTAALSQLASTLSPTQTMQPLSPQQLGILQGVISSQPIATARAYRIHAEQGELSPLLLLWSDLADQRWSDADAIFQLTYWHSQAECLKRQTLATPAHRGKSHSRLKERLVVQNRRPARRK